MHVTQRCHGLPCVTVVAKLRHNMMKQVGEKVPYGARLYINLRMCRRTWWQSYRHFSPLYLFLDALTTTSSFLLVVCEPKLTVGSSVCTGIARAAKVTQIFKQKLEIQHGCPVSSQGLHLSPQPRENRCFPGILTPESCYSASSSAAKVDMSICPLHSHRQPLHQMWLYLPSIILISCW